MISVADLVNKIGGRKFLLTVVGTAAVGWLTTQGVEPQAAWPIVVAILGGIFGIAAEDVGRERARISNAGTRLSDMAAADRTQLIEDVARAVEAKVSGGK